MREWLRLTKTRNRCQGGPGSRTHDHVFAAQLTGGSIGESRLHGSSGYKSSGPQDELRSGFPVVFHVHLVHADYHLALTVTNDRHVNRVALISDAKFLASAKVRRHLRTVDDVLAWQAGDVGARSANVFAVDEGDSLSLCSKRPCSQCGSRAAAENHEIVIFGFCFSDRFS